MSVRRIAPLGMFALIVVLALRPAAVDAQDKKTRPLLFCFWNVENFFDDKANPKHEHPADREFDKYFAEDKMALGIKLERLCMVLLGKEMNGGDGPDILAVAEIESERAGILLRDALNKQIKDKSRHYDAVVYRDPKGLRAIATVLILRQGIKAKQAVLLGNLQRILKVTVDVGGKEMIVIASHWASRVSDDKGGRRGGYARQIYNDFEAAYKKNPAVDYLVCGDFNDTPDDDSVVKDLRAIGDSKKVSLLGKNDPAMLYNPFAELAQGGKKGTHFFKDKAFVFDQICLSPGLLDGENWSYVNRSAAIVEQLSFKGRPDRFGGPNDSRPWRNRGASDHFPVTVQFRVAK